MPPKKAAPRKHELCVDVASGTQVKDAARKKSFVVGKQFASGGFGRIYTCHEDGSKTDLVMKVEPSGNGPLFTEIAVFQRILKPELVDDYIKQRKLKWIGLPRLLSCGIFEYKKEGLRFLVMPRYAEALESHREKTKTFKAADALAVVKAALTSLEYIHDKSYVHADIKAANILLERKGDFSSAVLVDFGLARNSSNNEDKPDKKKAHNGTAIFTSTDAHRGCNPSYRGDIEILGYNLLYWITGTLPWLADESSPEKVFQKKSSFLADISASINGLVKSERAVAELLVGLFRVSQKTSYTGTVDFTATSKLIDNAIKTCGAAKPVTSTRKQNVEQSPEKSPSTSTRSTGIKTPASRALIKKNASLNDSISSVASSSSSRKRQRASPSPTLPPSVTRRRVRARPDTSRVVKKALFNYDDDENEERDFATKPLTPKTVPKKSTPKRTPVRVTKARGIIPGLANKIAVKTVPQSTVDKENDDSAASEDAPRPRLKAGPTKRISYGTMSDPALLRANVPGVLNLPRGRRTILIEKISDKYKKLAANKASLAQRRKSIRQQPSANGSPSY